MKLLLDTHIWLWTFTDRTRLGRRVLSELADTNNELWLSPISVWEALLLHAKGRIQVPADLKDWWIAAATQLKEAPLTHEIVLAAHQLAMHRDPADRVLAATAQVLGLTLVTADQNLLGLGNIATLANR